MLTCNCVHMRIVWTFAPNLAVSHDRPLHMHPAYAEDARPGSMSGSALPRGCPLHTYGQGLIMRSCTPASDQPLLPLNCRQSGASPAKIAKSDCRDT